MTDVQSSCDGDDDDTPESVKHRRQRTPTGVPFTKGQACLLPSFLDQTYNERPQGLSSPRDSREASTRGWKHLKSSRLTEAIALKVKLKVDLDNDGIKDILEVRCQKMTPTDNGLRVIKLVTSDIFIKDEKAQIFQRQGGGRARGGVPRGKA